MILISDTQQLSHDDRIRSARLFYDYLYSSAQNSGFFYFDF